MILVKYFSFREIGRAVKQLKAVEEELFSSVPRILSMLATRVYHNFHNERSKVERS